MMFSNDHHHPHHNIFLRHLGASQMLWLSSSPPMQSSSPSHFHLFGIHLEKKHLEKNTPRKNTPENHHICYKLSWLWLITNTTKIVTTSDLQHDNLKENDHPQKNDHHPPQKFTILKKMMNIIKKIIQTCGHCIQTHWLRTLLVCRLKKCESEIEKEQNFLGQNALWQSFNGSCSIQNFQLFANFGRRYHFHFLY